MLIRRSKTKEGVLHQADTFVHSLTHPSIRMTEIEREALVIILFSTSTHARRLLLIVPVASKNYYYSINLSIENVLYLLAFVHLCEERGHLALPGMAWRHSGCA